MCPRAIRIQIVPVAVVAGVGFVVVAADVAAVVVGAEVVIVVVIVAAAGVDWRSCPVVPVSTSSVRSLRSR